MTRGTITRRLYFELDNGQCDRAKFVYRCADPYAVEFGFVDSRNVVSVWTFARSLLADGIESAEDIGDGDVSVSADRNDVRITLGGKEGTRVTVLFDPAEVANALEETYRAVPRGREVLDFDAELEALVADHG